MAVETRHYEFSKNGKLYQNDDGEPKQFADKLDECINAIAQKEGYISCDIVKRAILADGGNYLASLFEIDIKGETVDGNKETAIFVKRIYSDCEAMELLSVPNVYKTELFVYKELSKILNKLQEDANIPVDERYNIVKCYDESYEKAIIMENLTRQGFSTAGSRMNVISYKMAKDCVKQLAKFHGLSFVMEQQQPEYFDKNIKQLKVPHIFGDAWDKFSVKFLKMALDLLNKELRNKVENKLTSMLKVFKEYYTDDSIKYCLCHGDYRPNNIMSKEEEDGKLRTIPVDYQLIAYGCPVIDLIYFIYLSTDRLFRKQHVMDLKNLYYKSLEDFLHYFDMSAESVLPRKVFEHLFEEKLNFGLAITVILAPFMFLSENEEIPDIKEKGISEIDFKFDDKYRDRLRDAVEEMIDMGYL